MPAQLIANASQLTATTTTTATKHNYDDSTGAPLDHSECIFALHFNAFTKHQTNNSMQYTHPDSNVTIKHQQRRLPGGNPSQLRSFPELSTTTTATTVGGFSSRLPTRVHHRPPNSNRHSEQHSVQQPPQNRPSRLPVTSRFVPPIRLIVSKCTSRCLPQTQNTHETISIRILFIFCTSSTIVWLNTQKLGGRATIRFDSSQTRPKYLP